MRLSKASTWDSLTPPYRLNENKVGNIGKKLTLYTYNHRKEGEKKKKNKKKTCQGGDWLNVRHTRTC